MWTGDWKNQYGSLLRIVEEGDGRIRGTFRTALGDSGFAGDEAEVVGIHRGDCVHFAFSRAGEHGDTIAAFTGLMRDGKIETMWFVVSDSALKAPGPGEPPEVMKLPWAHAVMTNADTFTRVEE
jgi:hypothetical protein